MTEGAWVAGASAVSAAVNLAGTRAITQFVDPAVYGIVNLLQNVVVLVRGTVVSPVLNAGYRFYPEAARAGDVPGLRRVMLSTLKRPLIAVEILLLLGAAGYCLLRGAPVAIALLLALLLLTDVARTLEMTLLTAARRQRVAACLTIIESISRPLLIVGLVLLTGASVSIVLLAICASVMMPLLALYTRAHPEGGGPRAPAQPDYAPEMRRYALALIPYAIVAWTVSVGDRFMIQWLSSDAASVGIYAAGYGLISQPFIMVNGIVSLTLRPVYFAAVSDGDRVKAARTFRAWLTVATAICLLGVVLSWMLSGWLARVFLAPQYHGAAEVIPWIASGYFFYVVQQVMEQHLLAHKRTAAVLLVQSLGALLCVAVTVPAIARLGMIGAAYACPVYFAAQMLINGILIRIGSRARREG